MQVIFDNAMPDFSRPAEAETETQLEMRIECERVQQLRELIFKAGVRLPQTMALPFNGGQERTLLRFTRARADTEKSFAMLRLTLKWRELKNVDYCLREPLSGFFFGLLLKSQDSILVMGKTANQFLSSTLLLSRGKNLLKLLVLSRSSTPRHSALNGSASKYIRMRVGGWVGLSRRGLIYGT